MILKRWMNDFEYSGMPDLLEAIVIGVSMGGMQALESILKCFPKQFPAAVIVLQHLSPDRESYLVSLLNHQFEVNIKEAVMNEKIESGNVYIAPTKYHLLIEEDKSFSLSVDEPVNFAIPSIDILFDSAAEAYGDMLMGVILTGANNDGSRGLRTIKQMGGKTLVQDPGTAVAPAMPKAALELTDVDYILPLDEIGPFLVEQAIDG